MDLFVYILVRSVGVENLILGRSKFWGDFAGEKLGFIDLIIDGSCFVDGEVFVVFEASIGIEVLASGLSDVD